MIRHVFLHVHLRRALHNGSYKGIMVILFVCSYKLESKSSICVHKYSSEYMYASPTKLVNHNFEILTQSIWSSYILCINVCTGLHNHAKFEEEEMIHLWHAKSSWKIITITIIQHNLYSDTASPVICIGKCWLNIPVAMQTGNFILDLK